MTDSRNDAEAYKLLAQMLGMDHLVDAIEDGRSFVWAPKKGITAEEIAICIPLAVLALTSERFELHPRLYDQLPPNCKAHFHVMPLPDQNGS